MSKYKDLRVNLMDSPLQPKAQNAMFLLKQSAIAWKNMWMILVISIIMVLTFNPAAFRSPFLSWGLLIYVICSLLSTFPLRKVTSLENITTIWYFRFLCELFFIFLIIAFTGQEKSIMIIGIGAQFLRFIVCRPYFREILLMGVIITFAGALILLTSRQSAAFIFSKTYLAALFLFWFVTIYAYWAVKQYYREKDILVQKNIENQILIKELQLEKKLHLSEKFATIGQLAAGLAHEIRNPLTAVQGFIQLLINRNLGDKEKEYLDIIQEEMQRVGGLVGEFLLLAKPAAPRCEIHSLPTVVREVAILMQSEALLKEIQLIVEGEEECYIDADKEQIKQVIINLIKNALEVMPPGKKITLGVHCKAGDNYGLISVKDEGPGIPAADLKKIFDPFFTTKENGTGLGLAVSYRIIENHGGSLSVQSTPGTGTVFTIELPAAEPSSGNGQ